MLDSVASYQKTNFKAKWNCLRSNAGFDGTIWPKLPACAGVASGLVSFDRATVMFSAAPAGAHAMAIAPITAKKVAGRFFMTRSSLELRMNLLTVARGAQGAIDNKFLGCVSFRLGAPEM